MLAILSSFDELCGNATYAKRLMQAYELEGVKCEPINLDQSILREGRYKKTGELNKYVEKVCTKLSEYEKVNIHLELGLYGPSIEFQKYFLKKIARSLKNSKLLITVHRVESKPNFRKFFNFSNSTPKSLLDRIRDIKNYLYHKKLFYGFCEIIRCFNKLNSKYVVHTDTSFVDLSFLAGEVNIMKYPICYYPTKNIPDFIKKQNYLNPFDELEDKKIIIINGFITDNKNHISLLKSLNRLPNNYLLAINGSSHPRDTGRKTIAKLTNYLNERKGLSERTIWLGALSDKEYEAASYFSDCVVFPYVESGLSGSGNLALAREQCKKIVCSDIIAFRDNEKLFTQLSEIKTQKINFVDWNNEYEMADVIKRILINPQPPQETISNINMIDFCKKSLNFLNS